MRKKAHKTQFLVINVWILRFFSKELEECYFYEKQTGKITVILMGKNVGSYQCVVRFIQFLIKPFFPGKIWTFDSIYSSTDKFDSIIAIVWNKKWFMHIWICFDTECDSSKTRNISNHFISEKPGILLSFGVWETSTWIYVHVNDLWICIGIPFSGRHIWLALNQQRQTTLNNVARAAQVECAVHQYSLIYIHNDVNSKGKRIFRLWSPCI